MNIRPEKPDDLAAIRAVTLAAFENAPHSEQTEAAIVEALRAAGALIVSLVAIEGDHVVGHVAISPVRVDGQAGNWFGLGPVSEPERQRSGIGQELIRAALHQLREGGAEGCGVLGDPGYYGRFGFSYDPKLRYDDVPLGYFQKLDFGEVSPIGEVTYHPGFQAR